MNKLHKWHDVIVAFSEGREIQYRTIIWAELGMQVTTRHVDSLSPWVDFSLDRYAPAFNSPDFEWRVKPREPRRVFRVYIGGSTHVSFEEKEKALEYARNAATECVEFVEVLKDE